MCNNSLVVLNNLFHQNFFKTLPLQDCSTTNVTSSVVCESNHLQAYIFHIQQTFLMEYRVVYIRNHFLILFLLIKLISHNKLIYFIIYL